MSKIPPKQDVTAIGNVAKAFAGVTEEQVQTAKAYAETASGMLLGDALIASGALDPQQRDAVVKTQAKLRRGRASPEELAKVVQYVDAQAKATLEKLAEALDEHEQEDQGDESDSGNP